MATPLRDRLIALTEPLLGQLGYELVDLEYAPGRAHAQLRIFIDRPEGVGLDDCAVSYTHLTLPTIYSV